MNDTTPSTTTLFDAPHAVLRDPLVPLAFLDRRAGGSPEYLAMLAHGETEGGRVQMGVFLDSCRRQTASEERALAATKTSGEPKPVKLAAAKPACESCESARGKGGDFAEPADRASGLARRRKVRSAIVWLCAKRKEAVAESKYLGNTAYGQKEAAKLDGEIARLANEIKLHRSREALLTKRLDETSAA